MLWQGIWLKMLRQIPPPTHTHASLRRYSLWSWNGSLKTPGSEDWHKMASSLFTRSQNQAAPHTESRIVCVCHARRYEHMNYPWLKGRRVRVLIRPLREVGSGGVTAHSSWLVGCSGTFTPQITSPEILTEHRRSSLTQHSLVWL